MQWFYEVERYQHTISGNSGNVQLARCDFLLVFCSDFRSRWNRSSSNLRTVWRPLWAHYVRTRRHPLNRYAARRWPSHGHWQHAQKFGEVRLSCFRDKHADRQTHAERQTRSSHYPLSRWPAVRPWWLILYRFHHDAAKVCALASFVQFLLRLFSVSVFSVFSLLRFRACCQPISQYACD